MRKLLLTLICLLTSLAFVNAQVTKDRVEMAPSGKGYGVPSNKSKPGGSTCTNGICYHGGPVMHNTPNYYYIWYGTWNGSGSNGTNAVSDSQTTVTLLDTFAGDLNGSTYEAINSTYYDTSANVTGNVKLAASATDNYSRSTAFGDSGVQAIVVNAINNGGLPLDTNGVYFVLTSSDVNETSGFCTTYCGWHTHASLSTSKGSGDIKYSFVGNPDRCPSACEAQTTSPNNDSGGDGMANIVAHEQEEAISDPDLNAWYDRRGNENADKCAWTFGTESTASNGSKYNFTGLSGTHYLIQQNWLNANGGLCTMSY